MNNRGFFVPKKDWPTGNKSGSRERASPASAAGQALNRFTPFNPLSSKTQAATARSFSLSRPASTSNLPSPARFNPPLSGQGSSFLRSARLQTAPPIASNASIYDRDNPQDANDDADEQFNASNSYSFESPEPTKDASVEEDASAEYPSRLYEKSDQMKGNENESAPHSDDTSGSDRHYGAAIGERSPGFSPSQGKRSTSSVHFLDCRICWTNLFSVLIT